MTKDIQISAYVSDETKQRLDMYVRETGMKKARVIEDALTEYLDAAEHLPPETVVPTRVVLTKESFERFVERMESDDPPTPALVKLMRGRL